MTKLIAGLTTLCAVLAIVTVWLVAEVITTENRVLNVEKVVDPCGGNRLRSSPCQDRTCQRARDVGYKLTPECRRRLAGTPAEEAIEEVVGSGGNNPSNRPSPPRGGQRPQPAPVIPEPTAPVPSPPPSPGNSIICTPGTLPVLPAVCL